MGKLVMKGLTREAEMPTPVSGTLLQAAISMNVDWGYRCTKGTCARCRCLIDVGGHLLSEITDAEWNRLEEDEIEQGYRLACQSAIEADGDIRAVNRPYR